MATHFGLLKDLKSYLQKNNIANKDTRSLAPYKNITAASTFEDGIRNWKGKKNSSMSFPVLPNGKPSVFVADLEMGWILVFFSNLYRVDFTYIKEPYYYTSLGMELFYRITGDSWEPYSRWTHFDKDIDMRVYGKAAEKAKADSNLVSAKALSYAKRVSMMGNKQPRDIVNFVQKLIYDE